MKEMNALKASVVLGLGFGGEGKGIISDYLINETERPLIVRFSGGQQASQTVVSDEGEKHVFSNFGVGAFKDISTFWSKYCTFDPVAFMAEYDAFRAVAKKNPIVFADPLCPVTTPYDIFYNQAIEETTQKRGTRGVGYGATLDRNLNQPCKLFLQDLIYPVIYKKKLECIRDYYIERVNKEIPFIKKTHYTNRDFSKALQIFNESIEKMFKESNIYIMPEKDVMGEDTMYDHFIFTGSHGILLDENFGMFPNVTRGNTTSKNAFEIIERNNIKNVDMYYVTRAYQFRHGIGFMTNEEHNLHFEEDETHSNVTNNWQGKPRYSILDLDLIEYALTCDKNFSSGAKSKNIAITCLDQMTEAIQMTYGGKIHYFEDQIELSDYIRNELDLLVGIDDFMFSYSDMSNKISKKSELPVYA